MTEPAARASGPRIVIVTASMGGGHNGAAVELSRRLTQQGCETEIIEFLDAVPLRIGWAVRSIFKWLLEHAAWAYGLLYRLWFLFPFLWGPLVVFDCLLSQRRLDRWLRELRPDAVVSTYPLSSLVVGRLRRAGRLDVPACTFLTDFSVHPLWVHPNVDLHLAVSAPAAETARRLSSSPVTIAGPLVHPRFRDRHDRAAVRTKLGLAPHDRVALVVAGSWGVGDMTRTVEDIHADGRFTTITICGEDERLLERLRDRHLGVCIGWTDEMPDVMAAADVLVENAGGLTSLEAMTCGLPVINYRPIPGHGCDNAEAMSHYGASRFVRSVSQLHDSLDELTRSGPARSRAIRRGAAVVSGEPTDHVIALARGAVVDNVLDRADAFRPSEVSHEEVGNAAW